MNPNSIAARINLGIVHSKLGDYDIALKYYRKVLEINHREGDTQVIAAYLQNSGLISFFRGDYDEADRKN